jgi:hypothetical protein
VFTFNSMYIEDVLSIKDTTFAKRDH